MTQPSQATEPQARALERPRFLAGVLSTGIGTMFPLVLSFVGVLYVVRALDPDEYGVYLLLVVILQFASTLAEGGFSTSVMRGMHTVAPERRDDLLNTVVCALLVWFIAAGGIALLGQPLYFKLYDYPLLRRLIWYLPPMLVTTNLSAVLYAMMQGAYRYSELAWIRIVTAAVRLGVLLALVLVWKWGVDGLLVADLATNTIACTWAYARLPMRRRWVIDRKLLASTARFGFPLYLNNLLYFAYTRIDILMVGYLLAPADVAACSVAQRVPQNLKMVYSQSFVAVFFPRMAEYFGSNERPAVERLLNVSLRMMGFVTLGVAFVSVVFREEITVLLFSETYRNTAMAFALFMVAICVGLLGTIMGNTLVASGVPSAPVRINLVAITSNAIGNIILIPRLGFTGAAWATMLMVCATLPVNVWFLHRRGFHVDRLDYLKPLVLVVVLTAVLEYLAPSGLASRLLAIFVYLVGCWVWSPALRVDVREVTGQALQMLRLRRGDDATRVGS